MSSQAKRFISSIFPSKMTPAKPLVPPLPTYPELIARHIPIRRDASKDVHRVVHSTSFTLLSDEIRMAGCEFPVYRQAY